MKKLVYCVLCCLMVASMAVVSSAAVVSEEQNQVVSVNQIVPKKYDDCPQSGSGLHKLKCTEQRDQSGSLYAYYYECTLCGYNYYHWVA